MEKMEKMEKVMNNNINNSINSVIKDYDNLNYCNFNHNDTKIIPVSVPVSLSHVQIIEQIKKYDYLLNSMNNCIFDFSDYLKKSV